MSQLQQGNNYSVVSKQSLNASYTEIVLKKVFKGIILRK